MANGAIRNYEQENYLPGEVILAEESVSINTNKPSIVLVVRNIGDRPIQVGSHYHFYEVNKFLEFDRERCKLMRLNIPAGTSVRFEPGETIEIELVDFGGEKVAEGFQKLRKD